jgi:hypothetical protein
MQPNFVLAVGHFARMATNGYKLYELTEISSNSHLLLTSFSIPFEFLRAFLCENN